MDLSGLIFVALALVWALVLIPKALRAHDDVARTRSVDATSNDARVLTRRSRREAAAESTPQAPEPASVPEQRQGELTAAMVTQRRLAARAARRRRRVLGLLVLVTAATGIAAATGLLLPWAPAVPGATVLLFLLVARVTVRREHAAWDTRLRALRAAAVTDAATTESSASIEPSEPKSAEPDLRVVARNDQGVALVSDTEDTSTLDASAIRAAVAAAPPSLWDPLPMTLPTYVTKPRATRSVRTIDLGAPGVASSGHSAADTALVADAAADEGHEPPAQRAVGS